MLDPTLWAPSKSEDNNPLVAAAKGMIEKYEFRTIENPDSVYRPLFLNGGSPSGLEVLYHNVLVRKNQLDSVTNESYVKEIQLGCRRTVSTGLCDTLNHSLDTGWIKVFLYFQMNIEEDTAAMTAYLSKFDTRNPDNTAEIFSPETIVKYPLRGLAINRTEFEKMSSDPEVRLLESWRRITTALSHPIRNRNLKNILIQSKYSVDGRQPEKLLERDIYRIFKGK